MSFDYFEAESHVLTYNKFRPSPPQALIEKIVEFTSEKVADPLELAIDVGCGSGQSTEVLAPYFKNVLGLDSSSSIIKEARKKCHYLNVSYRVSPAEKMDVEDDVANVITVGQALHWLNLPKFYTEVKRILKRGGVFAAYGYNLPVPVYKHNKEIENIIKKYYLDILGEYTLPQSRKVYLDNYRSSEFNEVSFVEGGKLIRCDDFILQTDGTIEDMMGYITSWSAFQNYVKIKGEESGQNILKKFEQDFKSALGSDCDENKFKINFNYFLLLGRKQ